MAKRKDVIGVGADAWVIVEQANLKDLGVLRANVEGKQTRLYLDAKALKKLGKQIKRVRRQIEGVE
jgi:hypothetical protein